VAIIKDTITQREIQLLKHTGIHYYYLVSFGDLALPIGNSGHRVSMMVRIGSA
jgi:hypothetical protein